jgi:hypothetical protein
MRISSGTSEGEGAHRNVSSADTITVGDGGQPLHVTADQPRNHTCLSLAELRKLRCDLRHRTVVLTELASTGDHRCGGSVTLLGERDGKRLRPRQRLRPRLAESLMAPPLEGGDLVIGEGGHGTGAAEGSDPAESGGREVVIGMREGGTTTVGEGKETGGAAAAMSPRRGAAAAGDATLVDEGIEVAADGGGA